MSIQFHILRYFEALDKPGKYEALFSLLPLKQGFTIGNVKICTLSLQKLMRRSPATAMTSAGMSGFAVSEPQFIKCSAAWWAKTLDMQKLASLKPGGQFHNEVVTDAHAVSITFKKLCTPTPPSAASSVTPNIDLARFDKVLTVTSCHQYLLNVHHRVSGFVSLCSAAQLIRCC